MTKEKSLLIGYGVAIIAAVFLVYANALNGNFVWDDVGLITRNPLIGNLAHFSDIFKTDLFYGQTDNIFYRPLQNVSYMVDYHFWKDNPFGYHLTNVLIHSLVAFCWFLFIFMISENHQLSFLTAILFALHPAHTEAVAYISGRADLMASLFILLALGAYAGYRKTSQSHFLGLSALSFVLALLSKEIALIYMPLVFLYDALYGVFPGCRGEKRKKIIMAYIVFAVIYFLYFFWRYHLGLVSRGGLISATAQTRAVLFFKAFLIYLGIICWPVDLHMERGLSADVDTLFFLSVLSFFAFIVFLVSAYKKHSKLHFFACMWVLINYLPVSNIYPLNAPVAEHWIYLTSLGGFVLLAGGLVRMSRGKSAALFILVVPIILMLGCLTVKQNKVWMDAKTLYGYLLRFHPENTRVFNNLGEIYILEKNYELAEETLRKILEINPNDPAALVNLAVVCEDTGRLNEAIDFYQRSIGDHRGHYVAMYNLALLYQKTGRPEEAIDMYLKSIEANPRHASSYFNLGNIYDTLGNINRARQYWQDALRINPRHKGARQKIEQSGV